MASFHAQQDNGAFNIPPIMNPPPQIFGGGDPNGSPLGPTFHGMQYFADDQPGGVEESNEAKRRRIARV